MDLFNNFNAIVSENRQIEAFILAKATPLDAAFALKY
jgi:hypothetical protein